MGELRKAVGEAEAIEEMQLILLVPGLRQYVRQGEWAVIRFIGQYAERVRHDKERQVVYLHGMGLRKMMFTQVAVHYGRERVAVSYTEEGVCRQLLDELNRIGIDCFPVSRTFRLNPRQA